jgi:hypothetical protein
MSKRKPSPTPQAVLSDSDLSADKQTRVQTARQLNEMLAHYEQEVALVRGGGVEAVQRAFGHWRTCPGEMERVGQWLVSGNYGGYELDTYNRARVSALCHLVGELDVAATAVLGAFTRRHNLDIAELLRDRSTQADAEVEVILRDLLNRDAAAVPAVAVEDDEPLSAPALAKRFGLPPERLPALRKCLERWRQKNGLSEGWHEADNAPRNADRYYFRPSAVRHLIDRMTRRKT